MGPSAACVYGADKALPLHDTYIHTHLLAYFSRTTGVSWHHDSKLTIPNFSEARRDKVAAA